jgi:hypothetical protein
MASIPDEVLLAYIDGELSREEEARVAEALRRDPEAAEIARQFREASALLGKAYEQPMREATPQGLRDAIDRAAPIAPKDVALGPLSGQKGRRRRLARFALPLAAAVALTVGLAGGVGIGLAVAPATPAPPTAAAGLAAAAEFQQVLESAASGVPVAWGLPQSGTAEVMPVLTFRDDRGRFCREYQAVLDAAGRTAMISGIACRDRGGAWRSRLVMTVMPGESAANGGEFLPASGADSTAQFHAILDDAVGERVLSPEAERAALETGWQTE